MSWDKATKIRSLDKADELLDKNQVIQNANMNALRVKYAVLKFWCGNCHKAHLWAGKKSEIGAIDYLQLCPLLRKMTKSRAAQAVTEIRLEDKWLDVPPADANRIAAGGFVVAKHGDRRQMTEYQLATGETWKA